MFGHIFYCKHCLKSKQNTNERDHDLNDTVFVYIYILFKTNNYIIAPERLIICLHVSVQNDLNILAYKSGFSPSYGDLIIIYIYKIYFIFLDFVVYAIISIWIFMALFSCFLVL